MAQHAGLQHRRATTTSVLLLPLFTRLLLQAAAAAATTGAPGSSGLLSSARLLGPGLLELGGTGLNHVASLGWAAKGQDCGAAAGGAPLKSLEVASDGSRLLVGFDAGQKHDAGQEPVQICADGRPSGVWSQLTYE